jgi:hypothetical protein
MKISHNKVIVGGSDMSAFQPFHKSKSNKLVPIEQNEQDSQDTPITLKESIKHQHNIFQKLKNLFKSSNTKCWPC